MPLDRLQALPGRALGGEEGDVTDVRHPARGPSMRGTSGPYRSASAGPTWWPCWRSASARLTATVVLPTPPLPLATAMIGTSVPAAGGADVPVTVASVPRPMSAPTWRRLGHSGGMQETEPELDELQALLDTSLALASPHLRAIVRPGERTLTARQLVRVLTGMCTLTIATVTAGCEPRISAVDGHFLHARWTFTTARSAAKASHLRSRPAASAAHLRGEELGVFAHGVAEVLNPAGGPEHPDWPGILEHLTGHDGVSPLNWGDVIGFRLQPHWMVAYAFQPDELLAQVTAS